MVNVRDFYFHNLKKRFIDGNHNVKETLCKELRLGLDELVSNDFFGTEQQNDPRGDFREAYNPEDYDDEEESDLVAETGWCTWDELSVVNQENYLNIIDNILAIEDYEDKDWIADMLLNRKWEE
jgi:hypothetical protein